MGRSVMGVTRWVGRAVLTLALGSPISGTAVLAAGPASAEEADPPDGLPAPYDQRWDEAVGMWRGGQNGRDGHATRVNARLLLQAHLDGVLDQVPAGRVLANLRRAQETRGRHRGNFKMFPDDQRVTGQNVGFFTTLPLLGLRFEAYDLLDETAQADLDHMIREAGHSFADRVLPIRADHIRYPNAYIGDAVCLWLIRESAGLLDEEWRATFTEILNYYLEEEWGWGEHLSDMYAKVIQNQLCALRLWGRELSDEQIRLVDRLWLELATIDAAFAGGPRVPTIRCYWMDTSPATPDRHPLWFKPYPAMMAARQGGHAMGFLAARRGTFDHLQPPAFDAGARTIDCFGDSEAQAWVTPRYRYGTLTRWPLFPDQSQTVNTLCSTTMPVAFWHQRGDWGYLQWMTIERGIERWQPMQDRSHKRGRMEGRRLTDGPKRARHGWTAGVQCDGTLLVLRELAQVPKSWTLAADGFRLIEPSVEPILDEVAGWHRLVLDYGDEVVTVACHPLEADHVARLVAVEANDRGHAERILRVERDLTAVESRPGRLQYVWFLQAGSEAAVPPTVSRREGATIVVRVGGRECRIDRVQRGWHITTSPQSPMAADAEPKDPPAPD